MYIDPTNTPTHEAMPLDERHYFLILYDLQGWQLRSNCRISERRFMEPHANSPIIKGWH